jgi:hypothetical protein
MVGRMGGNGAIPGKPAKSMPAKSERALPEIFSLIKRHVGYIL